jgi:hypothetical protein
VVVIVPSILFRNIERCKECLIREVKDMGQAIDPHHVDIPGDISAAK